MSNISFNIDLSGISTTRPCPQDGDYIVTVTNLSVEDKPKGPMLMCEFTTENAVLGVPVNGGEPPHIPAGYRLTENYRLYPVENPKAPDWQVQLARFIDGVLGTNDATRPTDFAAACEAMRGKKCFVTVKAENDDQYGWQPRVKKVKPLA